MDEWQVFYHYLFHSGEVNECNRSECERAVSNIGQGNNE